MNPAYTLGKGLQETATSWGRGVYSAVFGGTAQKTPQAAETEHKKREQDASDAQFGFYGQKPEKGQPCFESS